VTLSGKFICTQFASNYGSVTTSVGANGVVGEDISSVLQSLGDADATQLINSIINSGNVIDGNLSTYATVTLAAALLGSGVDSVDLSVVLPSGAIVPTGQFAVYGLSFPNGAADLSLINSVSVTTSLAGVPQESNTLNQAALSQMTAGSPIWFGVETTKPYDTATVSLTPFVFSSDVSNAMLVFEFCPGGALVQ
jgi:hypothetical protein